MRTALKMFTCEDILGDIEDKGDMNRRMMDPELYEF